MVSSEGTTPLGRCKRRWDGSIKMMSKKSVGRGVVWTELILL
jgi:hypothetical protein